MKKQSPLKGGLEVQPQARNKDLVVREFPDEELVYDLKTHQAYCLNKTAAAVWKQCDGRTTVAGITHAVSCDLDGEVNEDVVWLALSQLSRSHLLETGIAVPGMSISRRKVMRKLGATALTVPLVMGIVAPTAVQAQSCGDRDNNLNQNAVGCPCQANNDCANSCCGFGNICAATGSVTLGNRCRVNCECVTGLTCKGSPQTCQP